MRFRVALACLPLLLLTSVACSDDSEDDVADDDDSSEDAGDGNNKDASTSRPDASVSASQSEAAFCSVTRQTCGSAAADGCEDTYACVKKLRSEVQADLLECLATRECGSSDDPCYDAALEPLLDQTGSYLEDCTALRASCDEPFSDDYCAPFAILGGDAMMSAVRDCLAEGCEGFVSCFTDATAAIDCE